jgi:hypothetical protein
MLRIRRLLFILVLAGVVLVALSFWQGGEPFRWFGKKSEQAGEVLKKKSDEFGEKADELKKKTEDFRETTEKVKKGVEGAGEKIKEFAGAETEKKKETR